MSEQTRLGIDCFSKELFGELPDGLQVFGAGGNIQFVNAAGLAQMEANSDQQVIGRNYSEFWPTEMRPQVVEALRQAAAGQNSSIRGYCPTLKGTHRWCETHLRRVEHALWGGGPQIIGVTREISDTMAYGVRHHSEERRFFRILESFGDGIYETNAEGLCTYANSSAARMLGYLPDELVGQPLHELIHHHHADGRSYPREECPIFQSAQNGVPRRVDDEVLWHKDGHAIDVSYAVFPSATLESCGGAVVTFADSSERKRAENDLRRLASELSDADRRKTEFIAMLAHELRNPLAPVRTGLQFIARAGDDKTAVAKVRVMMERQLGQMVHLVNDLLDVARVSSGKISLQLQKVDLKSVLSAAIEASQSLISAAHHTLSVELPDMPIKLHADPTRLTQVFTNLLNNAAKYTPDGGQITIHATVAKATVTIAITDSGIGLPAKSLSYIFEMFTRVGSSAAGKNEGLGIGLNLVRRLVELHAGHVEARSQGSGQGSTFLVTLPLAGASQLPELEARRVDGDAANRNNPIRIMLVDDNVDAVETLSMLLEGDSHRILVAHSGKEALRSIAEFKPEIVFLDIGMPEMNGYEVSQAIRAMPDAGSPVLVALTGWGGASDRERTFQAGFNAHLTKPADVAAIEEMVTSVRSVDRRGRPRRSEAARLNTPQIERRLSRGRRQGD
jgi:PAS domain S-box-containing protein